MIQVNLATNNTRVVVQSVAAPPAQEPEPEALTGGGSAAAASIELLELMPLLTGVTPGVNTAGAGINQPPSYETGGSPGHYMHLQAPGAYFNPK